MTDESVMAKGLLGRLGTDKVCLAHESNGRTVQPQCSARDHGQALALILQSLVHPDYGPIDSIDEIQAVGHRVVHGGEKFSGSVSISPEVIDAVETCAQLAPLHNPPNLVGIRATRTALPSAKQVVVFDTAFHSTLPPQAFIYALPYQWYEKHGIRRYGFHGTSHQYVAGRAARMIGQPLEKLNLITAHLGNGCSITAIRNGQSVDHSMGLTPMEGLVMGTRAGDIDPGIIFHLQAAAGLSHEQINQALQHDSGLLGISGLSNDMRDIVQAAEAGQGRAKLALEIFSYRLKKYVGSYTAVLGRVDALVFTGGIGENSAPVRQMVLQGLDSLGYVTDTQANLLAVGGREVEISSGPAKILVVPTNEELLIARQTLDTAGKL